MQIELNQLSTSETYFTLTQTVLPRPVAWVLTENEDCSHNLAPFSYFNAVCSDPPLLMVSIGKQKDGRDKDTIRNIKTRSQFVIHIASCDQLNELNQSAATLPPCVSELDKIGLKTALVDGFPVPRITECKVAFFCDRYEIQTIGNKGDSLLFAEVREIYIDDECVEIDEKGRMIIDANAIQPLARLGAGEYADFGTTMTAKRPA
ncbi:MAG TPA: protein/domain typically associated with flavoprotein oxygenase, DIM6/NTAB family protein [Gammaproteobacteria bacterium]|nr:protein/domain typically associated with flavoprotein oxygenase, DIM6/NTAB family protein [Gammaproteobacteria bacterium]